MSPTVEAVVKATQCAELLHSDIRAAHKLACRDDNLLQILIRDLIGESVKVHLRLLEIQNLMIEKEKRLESVQFRPGPSARCPACGVMSRLIGDNGEAYQEHDHKCPNKKAGVKDNPPFNHFLVINSLT